MIEFSNSPDDVSCTGWVYCLASDRGRQCKIGMTRKHTVRARYPSPLVAFEWAIKGAHLEKPIHELLEFHRLNKTFYTWKTAGGETVHGHKVTCAKWMNKHERHMKYDRHLQEFFAITPADAKRIVIEELSPVIQ